MTNRPPISGDGTALDAAVVELDAAKDDEGCELHAGKSSRGRFLFGFVACAVAAVGGNVALGSGFD